MVQRTILFSNSSLTFLTFRKILFIKKGLAREDPLTNPSTTLKGDTT
jgi:hypothetical protein